MATFLMLGKYSTEGIKEASPGHTKLVVGLIEKCGGNIRAIHALLGGYDLALMGEFPGVEEAMHASLMVGKALGITFSTYPAVAVEKFDQMMGRQPPTLPRPNAGGQPGS